MTEVWECRSRSKLTLASRKSTVEDSRLLSSSALLEERACCWRGAVSRIAHIELESCMLYQKLHRSKQDWKYFQSQTAAERLGVGGLWGAPGRFRGSNIIVKKDWKKGQTTQTALKVFPRGCSATQKSKIHQKLLWSWFHKVLFKTPISNDLDF